jgi:hypothetical protein
MQTTITIKLNFTYAFPQGTYVDMYVHIETLGLIINPKFGDEQPFSFLKQCACVLVLLGKAYEFFML